jgi:hypothetical protein
MRSGDRTGRLLLLARVKRLVPALLISAIVQYLLVRTTIRHSLVPQIVEDSK